MPGEPVFCRSCGFARQTSLPPGPRVPVAAAVTSPGTATSSYDAARMVAAVAAPQETQPAAPDAHGGRKRGVVIACVTAFALVAGAAGAAGGILITRADAKPSSNSAADLAADAKGQATASPGSINPSPNRGSTSDSGSGSATQPATQANALDVVTVGGTNEAPTVTFTAIPLTVTTTTTKIVTSGTGAKLTKASNVTFNYVLLNGKDGKQIESSFGKKTSTMDLSSTRLLPGLSKGLIGRQVGSQLLLAMPPLDAFGSQGNAKAGFGPNDTVVFFIDILAVT